ASATQRAGRAGRTRPGVCVRLYTTIDYERRPEHQPPEIARLDLAELVLELRAFSAHRALEWLDPPPAASLAAAEDPLVRLGPSGRTFCRCATSVEKPKKRASRRTCSAPSASTPGPRTRSSARTSSSGASHEATSTPEVRRSRRPTFNAATMATC